MVWLRGEREREGVKRGRGGELRGWGRGGAGEGTPPPEKREGEKEQNEERGIAI